MILAPQFNKEWTEAYMSAALEVNVQKMPDRIVAARDAIAGRLKDVEGNSDHHAERHEIEAALASLTRFELESRIWPTVGAASR